MSNIKYKLLLLGVTFLTAFCTLSFLPFAPSLLGVTLSPLELALIVAAPILFLGSKGSKQTTCRMGKLSWDRNAFCRGWLITGGTGCGKTQCGINILMHEVFKNENGSIKQGVSPWGGLCIDEKGLYWQTLREMAAHYNREHDLVLLQTRPDTRNNSWQPIHTFNLLSDNNIPANTYASAIVTTAISVSGGASDKGFFKTQAESNIGWSIELIRSIGQCQRAIGIREQDCVTPNLKLILQILTDRGAYQDLLEEYEAISEEIYELPSPCATTQTKQLDEQGNEVLPHPNTQLLQSEKLEECLNHFDNRYWNQPKDQLGGVQGTIYNYLNYFTNDDVAEVFCSENTFDFNAIDEGKIICIAMPQKLQIERRYVCTLLKLLFYNHVLRRFDKPKEQFNQKNLLICWQDEAQRFITEADGNVDVIREAGATTIMACQSKTSLYPPLGGKEKANVTILNLRNRMIFRAADEDCAQASADFIGKSEKLKKENSYSRRSGKSITMRKTESYKVKPSKLREMKDFTAVICHSDGPHKQYLITPKTPTDTIPSWWKQKSSFKNRILSRFGSRFI